jgi:hypothetical protein
MKEYTFIGKITIRIQAPSKEEAIKSFEKDFKNRKYKLK